MTASHSSPTPGRIVALAAGGTGGHMFPAQALARELLSRGSKVALITDRRGSGFGADLPEVRTERINAGALAGGSIAKKLSSVGRLALGYLQARSRLRRLKADTVVGFGGYASVPTVMAGAHRGLRVVLHEQNAVLGRANRLLAPRAHTIASSFAEVRGLKDEDRNKVVFTGNPVRPAIAALGEAPYPRPEPEATLRLLVIGGSQGAEVFNTVVPAAVEALPEGLRRRLAISQQVRGPATDKVRGVYETAGVTANLAGFFEDMPERLRGAHMVIGRAGASTIAELAAAGRPAVLVPYPYAADDHQTANARAFAATGGGWVLPQAELTAGDLSELLARLLADPSALQDAAAAAYGFGRAGAAGRLADLVCGSGTNQDDPARREAAA
ncbi:MAG: undecaprenyldiphospho-muramoylpentapeptide beta-N-acetylglucosaminyltransferase [Kiloniellales bacterium]|nr:undecaprenyldiphospho-muramoylpentapeptide beta-N-acetylglucosaminyltransferase [Kiloniellales bacterium]